MTIDDLKLHVRDWCEWLCGKVPEDKLSDCYLRARDNPDRRSGPVTADEILREWYKFSAGQTVVKRVACEFCKLREAYPESYAPCPFHVVSAV